MMINSQAVNLIFPCEVFSVYYTPPLKTNFVALFRYYSKYFQYLIYRLNTQFFQDNAKQVFTLLDNQKYMKVFHILVDQREKGFLIKSKDLSYSPPHEFE